MNRLMIVEVSHECLAMILRAEWKLHRAEGRTLPEDAVLVAVHTDGRTIFLTYRSDAFEPVPDGAIIPTLDLRYRRPERTGVIAEPSIN